MAQQEYIAQRSNNIPLTINNEDVNDLEENRLQHLLSTRQKKFKLILTGTFVGGPVFLSVIARRAE